VGAVHTNAAPAADYGAVNWLIMSFPNEMQIETLPTDQTNEMLSAVRRHRRNLFFCDCQVLRAKSRVYGKKLPPSQVLVKLRQPGQRPIWKMLERATYDREKHFRGVRTA
jgi:hypothetical protein